MTERNEDSTLRQLFSNLRERDRRRAPAFERTWDAAGRPRVAPRRTSTARVGLVLAAAAGLALVAFAILDHGDSGRAAPDLAAEIAIARELAAWEAPTDFLVEISGLELLDSVPTFGAGYLTLPADAADPSGRGEPAGNDG